MPARTSAKRSDRSDSAQRAPGRRDGDGKPQPYGAIETHGPRVDELLRRHLVLGPMPTVAASTRYPEESRRRVST